MNKIPGEINIAILASGNGSNAEAIVKYFAKHPHITVKIILSNNKNAFVLERAKNLGIPAQVFGRRELYESGELIQLLKQQDIQYIVLAGFLWLAPESLLKAFPNRIINIHPALLPKYGGKGMYGMKVHDAVIMAGEGESGITIHLLNEKYDEGKVLFQAKVAIERGDSAQVLAGKVNALEYLNYPITIENWIKNG